jgi:2-polyprenyl-3-methyl-5-hydroxy-6-metoxy-1,4-benzoquinol methylase
MGLESVYRLHHSTSRAPLSTVEPELRGPFLRQAIGTGKDVLDAGCRDGGLTRLYCAGNRVTGIDIDAYALKRAQEDLGIEAVHADLTESWPFSDRSFDVVVAGEVLEHVFFPARFVERAARVLRPGGIFLGSIPHAFCMQNRIRILLGAKTNTPLADPTHVNHFYHSEFRAMLAKHFAQVQLVPVSSGKYRWMPRTLKFYFSQLLLFRARTSE